VFFPSAWLLTFYRKNGFFVKQEKIYQPNMVAIGCRAADDGNERSGFLYVGQLEAHKGIMLLLGAMTKIPNAKLVIVGDGSLMPEIKKRAENNPRIAIYGRVPREELPKFYNRARATVFPSLAYENAPMVITESLACGTPVIASRLGGAPELIREGENGATFAPGDAEDLRRKMEQHLK
jgi:glycosyltransferase involved in cell wall biosynthesis